MMNNEKNYMQELEKYKKEFNNYLIEVKNGLKNYNEKTDSTIWVYSSKLFNLIEKIKLCGDKIKEELEDNTISNNYELINKVPKGKASFIEMLNNINLFKNEQELNNFREMKDARVDNYIEKLTKYNSVEEATSELQRLEENSNLNYAIFSKDNLYIIVESKA